ncbi:MAG: hypothetical protein P1V20_14850, partial [Verrucomicrobiales bacterium]|nr:hypothetical protein [Verrucomicrobiales bacterium]
MNFCSANSSGPGAAHGLGNPSYDTPRSVCSLLVTIERTPKTPQASLRTSIQAVTIHSNEIMEYTSQFHKNLGNSLYKSGR